MHVGYGSRRRCCVDTDVEQRRRSGQGGHEYKDGSSLELHCDVERLGVQIIDGKIAHNNSFLNGGKPRIYNAQMV